MNFGGRGQALASQNSFAGESQHVEPGQPEWVWGPEPKGTGYRPRRWHHT